MEMDSHRGSDYPDYSNIILYVTCSECDYIDTLGKSFSFITISQFEVLTNPTFSHTLI